MCFWAPPASMPPPHTSPSLHSPISVCSEVETHFWHLPKQNIIRKIKFCYQNHHIMYSLKVELYLMMFINPQLGGGSVSAQYFWASFFFFLSSALSAYSIRNCNKSFVYVISFNPFSNPMRLCCISSILQRRKLRLREVTNLVLSQC